MAHFPKPFFRADRGIWYVQVHGKQHNLGRDQKQAMQQYHAVMARPKAVASSHVVGIIDGYLEWCKQHRSPSTFDWYETRMQSFVDSLPDQNMLVDDLKPYHVISWADSHKGWGPNHRRGAITAIQRSFNWALDVGHIKANPIRKVDKPVATPRDQVVPEKHYEKMLKLTRDQRFLDVLQFAWNTGARPQEIKAIEARHYSKQRGTVELPPAEAKGKKRWRIIYLNDAAKKIIKRLTKEHPKGLLFRNRTGKAWTSYSMGCRFYRFEKKIGVRYALYDFRHTWATRMLTKGKDALTVATLLGHVDGSVLARTYQHLQKNSEYLRQQIKDV